jgi:methylated-DNA-[protein]-cysteine S-methyltransferase
MKPEPIKTRWGLFQTSLGWCAASWTKRGISRLILPQKTRKTAFRVLKKQFSSTLFLDNPASHLPKIITKQTQEAFQGKPTKYKKFDLSKLTTFQLKVLRATCRIPRGKTRTYGWIARQTGSTRSFRAVGQALKQNPVPIFIPCHRVIGGENELGGFSSGISWKMRLLEAEGVKIIRKSEGSYRVQKL